jgi:hypothetical protein
MFIPKFFYFLKDSFNQEQKMIGNRLSLLSKLCFAAGGLPFQMFTNCISLFIAPFLLEIAQVNLLVNILSA